jgi:hypothetical protein
MVWHFDLTARTNRRVVWEVLGQFSATARRIRLGENLNLAVLRLYPSINTEGEGILPITTYSPDRDNIPPLSTSTWHSAPARLLPCGSLTVQLTRSRFGGAGALAHLLAAEPRRPFGGHLGEGATSLGFHDAEAVREHQVRLISRHRFSRYALIFMLVARRTERCSAHGRAEFPGLRGSAYRRLVIGSGAHRILAGPAHGLGARRFAYRSACPAATTTE